MDNVVALVFCGGEGTRLQPLSGWIRKELLPIGKRRQPVLEFAVNHLRRNGIQNIIFLGSSSGGDDIKNYFRDGRQFDVHITHQPDAPNCRGNGRALLWAIKKQCLEEKDLLIYFGDMIHTADLQELVREHRSKKGVATIAVSHDYVIPKGVATINENGFVDEFIEKPHWKGPGEINIGLLCINAKRLIQACGGKLPSDEFELQQSKYQDLMGNIITHLVSEDRVFPYRTSSRWLDMGSFEDYSRVSTDIDWLIEEPGDEHTNGRGLRVFISYHITEENTHLIERLVIPCLHTLGIKTISGGTLDRDHKANKSPLDIAEEEIAKADEVIAFATPDAPDCSPSSFVQHEVAFARGNKKRVSLYAEKGTKVPFPMILGTVYTEFERTRSGELILDVLQKVSKPGC